MTTFCTRTLAILALINIVAILYLNFTIELSLAAHFVILPWLALQSGLIFLILNHQGTNQ